MVEWMDGWLNGWVNGALIGRTFMYELKMTLLLGVVRWMDGWMVRVLMNE